MTHVTRGLRCALVVLAAWFAGCADPPAQPTPTPTPPPVVTPPIITSISTSVARSEVERDVTVTAAVQDAETAPAALAYVWSANVGTISGSGPTVTWRLPKDSVPTPVDVVVSLTVVEPYQALENGQIVNREHRVTRAAPPVRVHDSTGEISKMALHFLIDLFGDSSLSADQCLVDFWPACPGTQAERDDIIKNRDERLITSVEATVERVSLNGDLTEGEAVVPCTFRDIVKATGEPTAATGVCRLDVVYRDSRWWLCSSRFVDAVSIPAAAGYPGRGSTVSGYWRSRVAGDGAR